MKASELVRKLNAMIMQYGDKPIAEHDGEFDRWYTIDIVEHRVPDEYDRDAVVHPELDDETWFVLR